MVMATQIRFYTAQEAADILGCTDARVRQVLTAPKIQAENSIGNKHGRAWLLTQDDVEKLKKFITGKNSADGR